MDENVLPGGSAPHPFIRALTKLRNEFMVTSNGMAIGLFGTLIVGTIISLFAQIPGAEVIGEFAKIVQGLMGAGIGLGVGITKKRGGVALVAICVAGFMGNYAYSFFDGTYSSLSDPLSCYLCSILCLLALLPFQKRKTPVDLVLIPLIGVAVAAGYSFLLSYWVHYVTIGLGMLVELCFQNIVGSFFMCVVVSVLVGMVLTAPISSVALCVSISIGAVPLASFAAFIGCSTQMVGFALQTAYDNKWGAVIGVGVGTSMLQFKNIVRKPVIWLPTIIASAILGPFALLFPIAEGMDASLLSTGAGMGTSGLVGPLNLLAASSYSWQMALCVIGFGILAPVLLTFLIDLLFRKLGWICKGDFALNEDLR